MLKEYFHAYCAHSQAYQGNKSNQSISTPCSRQGCWQLRGVHTQAQAQHKTTHQKTDKKLYRHQHKETTNSQRANHINMLTRNNKITHHMSIQLPLSSTSITYLKKVLDFISTNCSFLMHLRALLLQRHVRKTCYSGHNGMQEKSGIHVSEEIQQNLQ